VFGFDGYVAALASSLYLFCYLVGYALNAGLLAAYLYWLCWLTVLPGYVGCRYLLAG
jgi:hypothetical protein